MVLSTSQTLKEGFAIHGLPSAVLDVVVAAIEQGSYLRHLGEIRRHRILDQFVGRTPALRGQFVKPGFCLRLEMYFHVGQSRSRDPPCQKQSYSAHNLQVAVALVVIT